MAAVSSKSTYQCHIEGLKEIHLTVYSVKDLTDLTLVFTSEKTKQAVKEAFNQGFIENRIICAPEKSLPGSIPDGYDENQCYSFGMKQRGDPSLFLGDAIQAILQKIGEKVSPKAERRDLPLQVRVPRLLG